MNNKQNILNSPNKQRELKNSNTYTYSSLQYFFWLLSGAEISILKECPTDYNRQASIGFTIFMTTLLAFFSGSYAGYYFSESLLAAVIFGTIWALLIFSIDRSMVVTMKKKPDEEQSFLYPLLSRSFLALLIALVISIPLELLIFSENIEIGMDKYKKERNIEYREIAKKSNDIEYHRNNISENENKIANIQQQLRGEPTDAKYISLRKNIDNLESELTLLKNNVEKTKKEAQVAYNRVPTYYDNDKEERIINYNSSEYRIYQSKLASQRSAEKKLKDFDHKTLIVYKKEKDSIYNQWYKKLSNEKDQAEQAKAAATTAVNKGDEQTIKDAEAQEALLKDKKGFVLRFMILEDLAKWNDKEGGQGRYIFILLWLVRIIFLTIEILPTIMKIITPTGAYDRALNEKEKETRLLLEQKSKVFIAHQESLNSIGMEAEKELQEAYFQKEKELYTKTLNDVAQTQDEIIQHKLKDFKNKHLANEGVLQS